MRNYLMMGVGVMTLLMSAGCSKDKDMYDSQAIAQQLATQYQASFEENVGKPNENQTWGFGDEAAARMQTRAIQPIWEFEEDADPSKFLSQVPAGVKSYDEVQQWGGYGTGVSYIENRSTDINIWGAWDGSRTSGGTLYIKGMCDFTEAKFYVASNTDVYLVSGATLKLNNANANDLQGGCNYYISPGAKIEVDGHLILNNGLHMYNHGTIEANQLSVNRTSVFYNTNIVKVNGELSTENSNSQIINDGVITATRLHTAGSSHVQNNNTMAISGNTDIDSNNNTWVNNGMYTTNKFIYMAGSCDVINNCKLIVKDNFFIDLGDTPVNGFRMDAGSCVMTNTLTATGPFFIYMGGGSLFKVEETATLNATKANYGIYNVGDEWSVLEAKNIVAGTENQGYEVTYGGKIAVVAETHFPQGYSGQYPYIDFKNGASIANIYAEGFSYGKPSVTIAQTSCSFGFGGGDVNPVIAQGRIICEDLGTIGDFDFNDVVFDAVIRKDGTTEITLLAAGGTLDLEVAGVEVHGEKGFNVGKTNNMWHMVNTGEPGYKPYTNHPIEKKNPVSFTAEKKYYRLIDIPIYVRRQNGQNIDYYQLTAIKGQAPQKICVPVGFNWDDEYISITKAYPAFVDWVEGEDPFDWNWIQSCVARFVDLDLTNNK